MKIKKEGEEDGVVVGDESGSAEKLEGVLEKVVDKEVVGVTDGKFSPLGVVGFDVEKSGKNPEVEVEKEVDYEGKENGSAVDLQGDGDFGQKGA